MGTQDVNIIVSVDGKKFFFNVSLMFSLFVYLYFFPIYDYLFSVYAVYSLYLLTSHFR